MVNVTEKWQGRSISFFNVLNKEQQKDKRKIVI
jgi:hypothetical protein